MSNPPRYEAPLTIAPFLRYAALFLIAGLVLVPLLATVLGGFKSLGDLRVNPFGLPATWEWGNYWSILSGPRYWQLLLNSLVIAVLTVVLTLAAASMAAFVFAHVHFFGSRFLLQYLLLGLMFPAAAAVLPLFIQIRDLGLLDSYWGVVLPQVAFGLGMSILLLRNFFRADPRRAPRCRTDRWLWLHPILPPRHAASVSPDSRDGGRNRLRA